ncbi:MerR family transcriptional regulator [Streptomyces sp. FR-008]|nr:MerR family transcriptional regulator [Streptomyces sp. FR-008]
MFTIGDFARHGRVSVRMLRHYDATGLLRPARVDPANGYRHYTASQLSRLNRIIALKELGFTLQQVRDIVDEKVDAGELRGMLRLRRAELEDAVATANARLVQVEARLRAIESEGHMPTHDVVLKSVPLRPRGGADGHRRLLRARGHQPRHRPAVRRAVPPPGGRGDHPHGPRHRHLRGRPGRRRQGPRPRRRPGLRPAPGRRRPRPRPAAPRTGGHPRPPRLDGRRTPHRPDPDPLDRHPRLPPVRLPPRAHPRMPREPRRLGDRTPDTGHHVQPGRRLRPS